MEFVGRRPTAGADSSVSRARCAPIDSSRGDDRISTAAAGLNQARLTDTSPNLGLGRGMHQLVPSVDFVHFGTSKSRENALNPKTSIQSATRLHYGLCQSPSRAIPSPFPR